MITLGIGERTRQQAFTWGDVEDRHSTGAGNFTHVLRTNLPRDFIDGSNKMQSISGQCHLLPMRNWKRNARVTDPRGHTYNELTRVLTEVGFH